MELKFHNQDGRLTMEGSAVDAQICKCLFDIVDKYPDIHIIELESLLLNAIEGVISHTRLSRQYKKYKQQKEQ